MSDEIEATPNESWVPEPLRDAPFFKPGEDGSIRPVEQVLADLTNAAQYMGNSIRIPGPDVEDYSEFHAKVMEKVPGLMTVPNTEDPDSVNMLYGKLGRPDNSDGYKVPEVEGFDPESIDLGTFKGRAFNNNMTQQQFENAYRQIAEDHSTSLQQATHQHEEAMAALKEEWGGAYAERMGAIGTMLKTTVNTPPEVIAEFDAGKLPASTIRWLQTLSDLGGESAQINGQAEGRAGEPTPEEAMMQLVECEKKLFAASPTAPEYAILMKRRMDLIQKAYPGADSGVDRLRA